MTSSDLETLRNLLPEHLRGVGFSRPPLADQEGARFQIEKRSKVVAKCLFNLGEKLLEKDVFYAALSCFDLSLKVRKTPLASLARAKVLITLGQLDLAEREIQRFSKWKQQTGMVFWIRGRILLSRHDYQGAQLLFEAGLKSTKEGSLENEVLLRYLKLNLLFLERDSLYSRNLSGQDYLHAIESLNQQVQTKRTEVRKSLHREIREMEPLLDGLEKLFKNWVEQIHLYIPPKATDKVRLSA